jgi:hypothetical protein
VADLIFCPLATCDWTNTNPDAERRRELLERHWADKHPVVRVKKEALYG